MLLARIEIGRYVRRPAFLLGSFLTLAALLPHLDPAEPVNELSMIAPAALIGLVGITLSAPRVWASDRCAEAAGSTPVPMAARTLGRPGGAGGHDVRLAAAAHPVWVRPADSRPVYYSAGLARIHGTIFRISRCWAVFLVLRSLPVPETQSVRSDAGPLQNQGA